MKDTVSHFLPTHSGSGFSLRMRWVFAVLAMAGLLLRPARVAAQIDPEYRQLLQLGYTQPLQGRGPLSGYAFYYHNHPGFIRSNLTARLVLAPTYVDTELGIQDLLGPHTDLGVGFAGGGFADSYSEIRRGKLWREESFTGHGAEANVGLYHLFNPIAPGATPSGLSEIPLQAVLKGAVRYSIYERDDRTDANFTMPEDKLAGHVRAGLRWGGREPLMSVPQAFEFSLWYEGQFRMDSQAYGYAGDREVEAQTHLFWARSLFAWQFTNRMHVEASLTGGGSIHADRLSAYRIGGSLPLASEFPLMIPGYYFQEVSAERFVLLNGNYTVPLGQQFEVTVFGSTAWVDYLPGLELPKHTLSGVGGALGWTSASGSWHILAGYGYGFDAVRGDHEGAHSVGILVQYDMERGHPRLPGMDDVRKAVRHLNPTTWRGFDRIFGR